MTNTDAAGDRAATPAQMRDAASAEQAAALVPLVLERLIEAIRTDANGVATRLREALQ